MGVKIFVAEISALEVEDSATDLERDVANFLKKHRVDAKVTWLQSTGHRDKRIYLSAIIEYRDGSLPVGLDPVDDYRDRSRSRY